MEKLFDMREMHDFKNFRDQMETFFLKMHHVI